jgi:hypothetical protein
MTALFASRPSYTKPTSPPLLPARLFLLTSALSCYFQGLWVCSSPRRLVGLHGERCYVILRNHFSKTLYGAALRPKAPPTEWLTKWLATKGAGATADSKYVRMDLGGRLSRCREVLDLFTQTGYAVELTAPNSFHQIVLIERPHQNIGNSIRAMLSVASLASRFWQYTFYHFLRLHSMTIHGDQVKIPYELCSVRKLNLSHLRTFGCRVYVESSWPGPCATRRYRDRRTYWYFLDYVQP